MMSSADMQNTRQMQPRDFDELYSLEDFYWWFVGRRELVRQLIRAYAVHRENGRDLCILDGGCGTGGTMKVIADCGEVYGCDVAWSPLEYCRKRGFSRLAACRVERLSFADSSFDVVASCDVLEHIHDDLAALREMYRLLRAGGVLIMTLPAHPYLWSEHDEALAHLRRYTRREIVSRLQEAGYRIEKLSAAVSFVFPIILTFRLLQRLRSKPPDEPKTDLRILPPLMNNALVTLLRIETWLTRYMNLPIGTSFAVVARKPG